MTSGFTFTLRQDLRRRGLAIGLPEHKAFKVAEAVLVDMRVQPCGKTVSSGDPIAIDEAFDAAVQAVLGRKHSPRPPKLPDLLSAAEVTDDEPDFADWLLSEEGGGK